MSSDISQQPPLTSQLRTPFRVPSWKVLTHRSKRLNTSSEICYQVALLEPSALLWCTLWTSREHVWEWTSEKINPRDNLMAFGIAPARSSSRRASQDCTEASAYQSSAFLFIEHSTSEDMTQARNGSSAMIRNKERLIFSPNSSSLKLLYQLLRPFHSHWIPCEGDLWCNLEEKLKALPSNILELWTAFPRLCRRRA